MRMNKVILIILALILPFMAFAEVHSLCVTQNDDNAHLYHLQVETDDRGELLNLIEERFLNLDDFNNNVINRIRKFNKGDLDRGVILYSKQGFDVIRLQTENLSLQDGGSARMFYKTNVLFQRSWSMKYSEGLNIIRKHGSWYATDIRGDRFNYAFFRAGKTGVKDINLSYRAEFDL